MSSNNQDLQATHQILSLLESSKSLTDNLFDLLSGVFVIVDESCFILKGNIDAARIFKTDHENLLGQSLSWIFKPESWVIFQKHFATLLSNENKSVEFELSVDAPYQDKKPYLWNLSQVNLENQLIRSSIPTQKSKLYSIIGKDISDLKKSLAEVLTLTKDLEVTKAVQSLLLPKDDTITFNGLKLSAFYQSAAQSGGDWWWYEHRHDGNLRLLLGDVTGHGAGSAMVTAAVASSYRTLNYIQKENPNLDTLPRILDILNLNLQGFGDFWMTMSAIEIRLKDNTFQWWSAGAPPLFVLRASGAVDVIISQGSPLGAGPLTIGTVTTPFNVGDRLFVFTDGVYEFSTPKHTKYGRSNLKRLFASTHGKSILETKAVLLDLFEEAKKAAPLPDDVSFILVDRT